MQNDDVDLLLTQWSRERPELDGAALGVAVRVQRVARLMRAGAENALRPLELKLWEYDALAALRRQGPPYAMPATELARATLLTSGAMTNRIDRLEARGLVRRLSDPADRRGVRVVLTEAGLSRIDEAVAARMAAADASVASLSQDELGTLLAGLKKVLTALDERATAA